MKVTISFVFFIAIVFTSAYTNAQNANCPGMSPTDVQICNLQNENGQYNAQYYMELTNLYCYDDFQGQVQDIVDNYSGGGESDSWLNNHLDNAINELIGCYDFNLDGYIDNLMTTANDFFGCMCMRGDCDYYCDMFDPN
jgi:hypothetical protein